MILLVLSEVLDLYHHSDLHLPLKSNTTLLFLKYILLKIFVIFDFHFITRWHFKFILKLPKLLDSVNTPSYENFSNVSHKFVIVNATIFVSTKMEYV